MSRDLKQRLMSAPALLAPGVYDALTGLVAQQVGFEAVYLSGASIAYTRLGRSDVGLTTATEVAETLARITERVSIPVIVDADTGFGNALNVQRTVCQFERAGAAVLQIEDQTFPKRCGHLAGKSVISTREMCGKLKAAVDARRDESTLIMARTDAIAVEGFGSALDRAEAYLECGIDVLFMEAPQSLEQMRALCEKFSDRIPLLANMVEGGRTPLLSTAQLEEIGYRIVIFPGGTARAVARTLQDYFQSLKRAQTTAPWQDKMLDFQAINDLIGTSELIERGKRYE